MPHGSKDPKSTRSEYFCGVDAPDVAELVDSLELFAPILAWTVSFWKKKWNNRQIAFSLSNVTPLLLSLLRQWAVPRPKKNLPVNTFLVFKPAALKFGKLVVVTKLSVFNFQLYRCDHPRAQITILEQVAHKSHIGWNNQILAFSIWFLAK
jgi:hypothetical protein